MEDFFLDIIILAAGNGKRMNSNLPKPFHEINNKPLLTHLLNNLFVILSELNILNQIHIVINKKHLSYYEKHYSCTEYDNLNFIIQYDSLGTGHAVLQTVSYLQQIKKPHQAALILFADTLILDKNILKQFIIDYYFDLNKNQYNDKLHLISTIKNDPTNYGRLVRNDQKQITKIVEEKDASEEIKKIQEIYLGPMLISLGPFKQLKSLLKKISNQNQAKEYYLTDLISIANGLNFSIQSFIVPDKVIIGINNQSELEYAIQIYNRNNSQSVVQ